MESEGAGMNPNSGFSKTVVTVSWYPPGLFTEMGGQTGTKMMWNAIEQEKWHCMQSRENPTNLRKHFRNLTSHLFSDLHSKRHLSKGEESFVFLRLKA